VKGTDERKNGTALKGNFRDKKKTEANQTSYPLKKPQERRQGGEQKTKRRQGENQKASENSKRPEQGGHAISRVTPPKYGKVKGAKEQGIAAESTGEAPTQIFSTAFQGFRSETGREHRRAGKEGKGNGERRLKRGKVPELEIVACTHTVAAER